jgi:hypothetical protein
VVPAFTRSADFAIDKPAGTPCQHLGADDRCGIHDRLRARGFPGCAVYDCFGAGQQVTQVTFGGRSRTPEMYPVFPVMRQLHEWLWYLSEALRLPRVQTLRADLERLREEPTDLTTLDAGSLLELDLDAHWPAVSALLGSVSQRVRSVHKGPDRRGADLVGASLRGADLRGADLRGAYLIGADLSTSDLREADLIGADLRGADLSAADLTDALFVTQVQLDAARGDHHTRLPAALARPTHWSVAQDEGRIHIRDG